MYKDYEKEANAFAAALLMPADKIQIALSENKKLSWQTISNMAETFNVSIEAMARRLMRLSKEPHCLIIHKDNEMWFPAKSELFKLFIAKQKFPDDLDYTDDISASQLIECSPEIWGILRKNYRLFYSSINIQSYHKIMTLLLVKDANSQNISNWSSF